MIQAVLRMVESVREPGTIVDLPYEWPDAGWETATIKQYQEEAHVVLNQRRRGEYRDDENYALRECKAVCALI